MFVHVKTRKTSYTIKAGLVEVVPGFRDMALESYSDCCRCGPQDNYQADGKSNFAVEAKGCEMSDKRNE